MRSRPQIALAEERLTEDRVAFEEPRELRGRPAEQPQGAAAPPRSAQAPANRLKVSRRALSGRRISVTIRGAGASRVRVTLLRGKTAVLRRTVTSARDTVTLTLKAKKAGTYRVFGRFVKARDYGTIQMAINGKPAGAPVDFYNDGVTPSAEIDLGVFELKAGANEFTATVTGANPKAEKAHMFGLDYLRLKAE